jgi:hypothetical protein
MAAVWPPAFVAVVYFAVGRFGFFPTDEGLIQGWSYRILLGQVPHRDFVSPLPMGSGVIHLVDFAVPAPLFEVSRVIATLEYCAYGLLFAWLIYRLPPWRWGLVAVAGTIGSILLNLNSFPLMAWYTVDGLLLVAGGLLAVHYGVQRKSDWVLIIGFLLLGSALVTKQSFVPAPVLGWVLTVPRLRLEGWSARLRTVLLTGLVAALPLAMFAGYISLMGGLGGLRAQLLGGAFVYGRPLLSVWSPRRDFIALACLSIGSGIVAGLLESRRRLDQGTDLPALALRSAFSAVVIAIPLLAGLGLRDNEWGMRVFWMLVSYVLVSGAVRRSLDLVGVAIIGCAWMSSLSYGYSWPNLVGGSAALYLLHRIWSGVGVAWPRFHRLRAVPAGASLLLLALTASVFYQTRVQDVYLDRPAAQLTATLQGVSPAFGSIRTNPETARYLEDMVSCIRRFPADHVAVLPENAAIYPALELRNPFPIDWMWPDSMHGSEARILATADQLNRDGDYLVLFQTLDEPQIVNGNSLPPATPDSTIKAYTPVPAQIYSRLNGQRLTCASFLVVYSPAGG